MDITFGTHVIAAVLFGLVFSGLYQVIAGPASPWPWRQWLAGAVVLAGLCYIILFGVVRV